MINVQGDAPPSDGDWDEFLAAVAAASNLRAFLICADNHGPNVSQRAKLAKMRSKFPLPKAVVTTSMVVRGIVTATSWLGSNVRAFAPSHIDEAFDYLDVPKPLRAGLLERVALLKTRLAGGETLEPFRGGESHSTNDLVVTQQIVEERVANIRAKLRGVPRGGS